MICQLLIMQNLTAGVKVIYNTKDLKNVPSSQSFKTKDPTFSNEEHDDILLPTKYYKPKRSQRTNVYPKSNSVITKTTNLDQSNMAIQKHQVYDQNQTRHRKLLVQNKSLDQSPESTNNELTERQLEQALSKIDAQDMLYSRKVFLLKQFQQAQQNINSAYNQQNDSPQTQYLSLRSSQDKVWTRETSKNELPTVYGKSTNSFQNSAYRDRKFTAVFQSSQTSYFKTVKPETVGRQTKISNSVSKDFDKSVIKSGSHQLLDQPDINGPAVDDQHSKSQKNRINLSKVGHQTDQKQQIAKHQRDLSFQILKKTLNQSLFATPIEFYEQKVNFQNFKMTESYNSKIKWSDKKPQIFEIQKADVQRQPSQQESAFKSKFSFFSVKPDATQSKLNSNCNVSFRLGHRPSFDNRLPHQGKELPSVLNKESDNNLSSPAEIYALYNDVALRDHKRRQPTRKLKKTSSQDYDLGQVVILENNQGKSLNRTKKVINRFVTLEETNLKPNNDKVDEKTAILTLDQMRAQIFDMSKLPDSPIKPEELQKDKDKLRLLSPAELRELKANKLLAKKERERQQKLVQQAKLELQKAIEESELNKKKQFEERILRAKMKQDQKVLKRLAGESDVPPPWITQHLGFMPDIDKMQTIESMHASNLSRKFFSEYTEAPKQEQIEEQTIDDSEYEDKKFRSTIKSFFNKTATLDDENRFLNQIIQKNLNKQITIHDQAVQKEDTRIRTKEYTLGEQTDNATARKHYQLGLDLRNTSNLEQPSQNQTQRTEASAKLINPLTKTMEKMTRKRFIKKMMEDFYSEDEEQEMGMVLEKMDKGNQVEQDHDVERHAKFSMQKHLKRAYEAMVKNEKMQQQFYTNELEDELRKNDDMKIFVQEFKGKSEIMLPLANKINDKILSLQGYTLSIGQCLALTKVFQESKTTLRVLHLDNCGVDDEECATVLQGLVSKDEFQVFYYKNNTFGEESLSAIGQIFQKPRGSSLLQLRLVNCRTDAVLLRELLSRIRDDGQYLRSLGLIQMYPNQTHLEIISQILQLNMYLDDLDLSWNGIIAKDFKIFFKSIGINRNLQSLNLSWNQIIEIADQSQKGDFKKINEPIDTKKTAMERLKLRMEELNDSTDYPKFIARSLGQFVRFNTRLQHLDLSHTGLSEKILVAIVPGLQRSKSILSLHLNFNPGITPKVTQFYEEQIKCKPGEQKIKIRVFQYTKADFQKPAYQVAEDLGISINQVDDIREQHEKTENTETISTIAVKSKLKYMTYQDIDIGKGSYFGIYRTLGHKSDIPGSGQWVLSTEQCKCWVCEYWSYCFVFWNDEIGSFNERSGIQIGQREKERVISLIRRDNEESFSQHPDKPMLFTQSTDWKGKPFVRLLDFIMGNEIMPDWTEELDRQVKRHVRESGKYFDPDAIAEIRAEFFSKKKRQWMVELLRNWTVKVKGSLRYKKPFFINMGKVIDPENTYVLPIFLKPGRNHFFIRGIKQDSVTINTCSSGFIDDYPVYYNRHTIEARDQPIPPFVKILAKQDNVRTFELSQSIFRNWPLDTPKKYMKCMKYDKESWKLNRFITDLEDLKLVEESIESYYGILKEIFIVSIAYGHSYPTLDFKDFCNFCSHTEILDKLLRRELLNVYFVATNVEFEDQDWNDDSTFCRFEFIECLLRICRGAYLETKKCKTFYESFTKLMDERILPYHKRLLAGEYEMCSIQQWRQTHYWTLRVNDILEANLDSLKEVYNNLSENKGHKSLSMSSLTDFIMQKCSEFEFTLRTVPICFALSKATIVDESTQVDEYELADFLEFLECLGRLAYERYRDTTYDKEWDLARKLEPILDAIFQPFGIQRVIPMDLNVQESEPDEDY